MAQNWDAPAPAAAFLSAPTVADIPAAYAPDAYLPPAYVSGRGYSPGTDLPGTAFQTPVTRPESVVLGTRVRTGAADEMFRAWDSSVRAASGAPGRELGRQPRRDVFRSEARQRRVSRDTARRRRLAWQAARVGVPAAVIVTVGAGAVMMLTGKPGAMMADRSDQSASAGQTGGQTTGQAANSTASGIGTLGQAAVAGGAFAGYPGAHGPVTVDSAVMAGGTQVAVGNADGHPAIWHRDANGTWSLVSATLLAAYTAQGGGGLSSIAHGRDGWVAVGDDTSGAGSVPVVLSSADGLTWHVLATTSMFSTPGSHVSAVAAGTDGYAVVGQQTQGARRFAAFWWSPDLRNWARASNGGLDGRLSSSDVNGVTATASGFVAVGTHDDSPMIWTSGAGLSWTPQDIGQPAGSSAAKLEFAAAHGSRVVAAGNATLARGDDTPFVMVSSDAGRTWKQQLLPTPDGLGAVTALTASGDGFIADGLVAQGSATARHSVTWTSPDGLTWSAPTPASSGA
jgi:hypothetical protein